jgi:hypothetical protein
MTHYKFLMPWFCPECKIHGRVYFNDGIDIMCVVDKVIENHKRMSPECQLWWSQLKLGEMNVQDTVKENVG